MATTQADANLNLEIYPREGTGKGPAFRTRAAGRIPAVIYNPTLSKEGRAIPVALSVGNFRRVFKSKGHSAIVSLEAKEGAPAELGSAKALFQEVQVHPLKNSVIHVDINQLDMDRPVRVVVPLKFVGKAKGLAEGGIMSIMAREVEIKALPASIPDHIDVDVSELEVNDSLQIDALAKKIGEDKFEFIYESSFPLVTVVPPADEEPTPQELAQAAAAEAGEAAAAGGADAAGADAAKADDKKADAKKD